MQAKCLLDLLLIVEQMLHTFLEPFLTNENSFELLIATFIHPLEIAEYIQIG